MAEYSEKEVLEATLKSMESNARLRPCRLCWHWGRDKENFCSLYQCEKKEYNYGNGKCFLTHEEAVLQLIREEKERSQKRKSRLWWKMDMMENLVNGAALIREDIWQMIEEDFKRLEVKMPGDDETYAKSKRNMERLDKAYKQMKAYLHDFKNEFERYVEYWHKFMFTDEQGNWDVTELDKYWANGGLTVAYLVAMYDRTHLNPENARKIMEFIQSLEGSDVLEESDLNRYIKNFKSE